MSRFGQPSQSKPTEPVVRVEIEGSFLCQTCNESVDDAIYLPEAQLLAWKCSEGHKSYIEKFTL